jgi:hypothetical protein
MVSTHAAIHIGGSDFMNVHPMFGKKPIDEIAANLLLVSFGFQIWL